MSKRKPIAKIAFHEVRGGELRIIIPMAVASAILQAISGKPLPGYEPVAAPPPPPKPCKRHIKPRSFFCKSKAARKSAEASP